MPRNHKSLERTHARRRRRRSLVRTIAFVFGSLFAAVLMRERRSEREWASANPSPVEAPRAFAAPEPARSTEPAAVAQPNGEEAASAAPRVPFRFAATMTMVALFFAGAAFSAGAGGQVSDLINSDGVSASADASATDATVTDAAAVDSTSVQAADPAVVDATPVAADSGTDPAAASSWVDTSAPASSPATSRASHSAGSWVSSGSSAAHSGSTPATAASTRASRAARAHARTVARATRAKQQWEAVSLHAAARVKRQLTTVAPKVDPEAYQPGSASIVWLNRALPDPTPPAKRLTDPFAVNLVAASRAAGVKWALVLGVLRAEGANGSVPASRETLRSLAFQLAALQRGGKTEWEAVAAFSGDTALADRAVALEHYDRAVGLWALVHGLEAAKSAMINRLLADPRASIYEGGRKDMQNGKIDVRVVAVIAYLAETFDQVTVSCLVSGHRLYARPGVISAHIYGHAVDVAGLDNMSIAGNQEPGGLTEHAVRDLLLLPSELMPRQVISLLGLGGPSFPLADHSDHIHVGY